MAGLDGPPRRLEGDAARHRRRLAGGGALLLVNADVAGELRVRVLDAAGVSIPGFDAADCAPIRGDLLRHRVAWRRPLAELAGRQVQLEFAMREARLFAFELRR